MAQTSPSMAPSRPSILPTRTLRAPAMAALALAAGALAQAPGVRMKVTTGGEMSGTLVLSQRLLPDGRKAVSTTTTLGSRDRRSVVVVQESVYSPSGRPIRMLQRTSLASGKLLGQAVTQFGAKEAAITLEEGGRKTSTRAALPSGSLDAKNEFWLIRDKVAPGTKHTYQRFDLGTSSWILTTAEYIGPATAKVGGKTVKAHLITLNGVKAYSDDKGIPLRIESGQTVLERMP